MKYEVVGVQFVDFKSREGDKISGTKLHCVVDSAQSDVFEGRKVETLFLSQMKFGSSLKIHPGDTVDVDFNRYGKVEFLEVV